MIQQITVMMIPMIIRTEDPPYRKRKCADGDQRICAEEDNEHINSANELAVLLVPKFVHIHHSGHTPILPITKVMNTIFRIEIPTRIPKLKNLLWMTFLPR